MLLVDFSDGKLSLGNIFTTAKRKAQGYQDVLDNFNNIDDLSPYLKSGKLQWKKLTDKIGEVDSVTKRYLNDCIDLDTQTIKNKASIEDLANAYKQSGHSFEGFISGLKGVATNMAVTLAVSLAIKGAMYIWDKLNVTYEEQAKIVSDLNDEIKSLEEEEQKLLGLRDEGGLTEAEQSRLNYLQERLALDKEIYKQEQKKLANSELYGEGDLLSRGILGEGGKADKTNQSYSYLSSKKSNLMNELDNAIADRSGYEPNSFFFNVYDNKVERTINNLNDLKNSLLDTKKDYLDMAQAIRNDIDSGAYDDDNIKKEQLEQTYQEYLAMADKISSDIIDVNLKLNVIDADDYKNQIKNFFTGKGVDWFDNSKDLEYINNLSTEEARVVVQGIEDGSITLIGDMTKAVDDFREAKEKANDTELEVPDFKTSISSAKELADKLDSLTSIYNDVKDGGTFDFGSLADSDFVETFGKYTEEYQNFVNTLTNSPNDIKACQSAFDNLATAWLNGSGILDDLTEETADYTIKLLEEKGVVNAAEIVHGKLTWAKAEEIVQTMDLTGNIEAEISAILSENQGLGLNEQMLKAVALAKLTANGTSLNFSSDLEAIKSLTQGLGGAITMLSMYSQARDLQGNPSAHWSGMSDVAAMAKAEVQSAINNAFNFTVPTPKFTGGASSSSSGGSSSKTDPYKAEIDALQDYLDAYEKAQRKREQIDKKYDNAKTTAEKIDLMQQRIDAMREEQKAIEALNDARDKEIQKNVEKLKAQQFDISYDPTTDELQIKNIEHLNELKGENQEKTNKLIQDTEEMINTTKEMADANKDLADTWQDNVYTLSDYADELLELQETLHDEKITDIEFKIDVADELNRVEDKIDGLTEKITQTIDDLNKAYAKGLDNTSDYVQSLIKELMDAANDIKEAQKEIYENKRDDYDSAKNAVVKVIENNIEALQKQKEELEALNDEQDRALKLAELKEALSKAQQSKVIQVYRKGLGWVYEADQDAINEAKKNLADFENEERINAIDKEIEKWEDYKDEWDSVVDKWQEVADKMKATELFGADWEDRVNDLTLDVEDFGDKYYDVCEKISEITEWTVQDVLSQFKDLFVNFNNIFDPVQVTRQVKYFYATKDGTAPSGASIGDRILTGGGTYEIVAPYTSGATKNEATDLWSKKVDDIKTVITDANAGTYKGIVTVEELTDRVTAVGQSIKTSNSNIASNNSSIKSNTSGIGINTLSVDTATDAIDNLDNTLTDLPDFIGESVADGIQSGLSDLGDYVIGMDGGIVNNNNKVPGTSYDNNGKPIAIDEDSFIKEMARIAVEYGTDSELYKTVQDYYNSFFGSKGAYFNGINANKNAGYTSGTYYDNYDEFFKSFNATFKGIINGKNWYNFYDSKGRYTAASEDYFKNSYVLNRPSGYTDRERAQSTLDKAAEIGWLDELASSYNTYYTRLLDIINTPEGGDRAATTLAREYVQRAYDEILNAKNGNNNPVGSYDASGKKVVSVSYDRNGNIVKTGYSENAIDFSKYVDNVNGELKTEDVFDSPMFKAVSDAILSGDSYFNYENKTPENNVDTVRAYDSSYNNVYEGLKLSTDKQGQETRTNSERLADNTDAMDALATEFGDGTYKLVDAINDVVQVINEQGEVIGAINTTTGSVFKGNSYSAKSSSSSSSKGYSSDGTYGNYYSNSDINAIKAAQEAYKKAEAAGDKAAMDKAHSEAEAIRNKYGDASDISGIINNSSKGTTSTSLDSKGNTVTVIKDASGKTTSVTVVKHAKGTGKVKNPHFAIVDDDGEELILRSDEQGRGTYLEYGDQVFPHEESKAILNTYDKMKNYPEGMTPVDMSDFFNGIDLKSAINIATYPDLFTGTNTLVKNLDNISRVQSGGDTINENHFDNLQIVCPNVIDGNTLVAQLKTLSMSALQRSNRR